MASSGRAAGVIAKEKGSREAPLYQAIEVTD